MERRGGSEKPFDPELLWTSDNIRLVNNAIFAPSGGMGYATPVTVECNINDFPDPNKLTSSSRNQIRNRGRLSFRSRYAQLGLHSDSRGIMDQALSAFLEARHEGNPSFTFDVPVMNFAGAPIVVPEGTGLARFYVEPDQFAVNGELEKLVKKGEIIIGGDEGQEWKYYMEPNRLGIPEKAGIMLRVKDEGRVCIPERNDPILLVVGDNNDYRREVGKFHMPVNKDDIEDNTFWIGETSELILGRQTAALIDRDVHGTSLGITPNSRPALHIESRLVDAGSAWPIKVEIVGKANWVVFRFYHKK